jgi:hypothetical protein
MQKTMSAAIADLAIAITGTFIVVILAESAGER